MLRHIDVQRRTFLKIVALATAAEALPAWATMADDAQPPGSLVGLLRGTGNQSIVATLAWARAGSGWRTISSFEISPLSDSIKTSETSLTDFALRQHATDIVRDLLKAAAARARRVPPDDCELLRGCIVNRATCQRLPYRLVLKV